MPNPTTDEIPPRAITDLQVQTLAQGARLRWTPSHDDDDQGGAVQKVIIKMANEKITDENWENATLVGKAAGTETSFEISAAEIGQFFAIKSVDEAGNLAKVSNSPQLQADEVPPTISFVPDPTEVAFARAATPLTVEIHASEEDAKIVCQLGETKQEFTTAGIWEIDNDEILICTATDLAGNESEPKTGEFHFQEINDEVLISEILPNPSGSDAGQEWIELANLSKTDFSLAGWEIFVGAKNYIFPKSARISAKGFYFLRDKESGFTLHNSGTEKLILKMPDGQVVSELERTEKAPAGAALAWDTKTKKYRWTQKPTPNQPNQIVTSGTKNSQNYYKNAPSATEITVLLEKVGFRNSDGDEVVLRCVDCAEIGTDLGGWSVWSDKQEFEFPLGFVVRPNESFSVKFKQIFATDLEQKIGRTSARGLTATDEQVTVRDAQGAIADAVCWTNRDGKWSHGEQQDMSELIAYNHWHSATGLHFDETICVDSSQVRKNQAILRVGEADTNTATDWDLEEITEAKIPEKVTTAAEKPAEKSCPEMDLNGLQISGLLPNPTGADKGQEWVRLQNTTARELNLCGVQLRTARRQFALAKQMAPPHGEIILSPLPTKFLLKNENGRLELVAPDGKILNKIQWKKARENHALVRRDAKWEWQDLSPEEILQKEKSVEKKLPKKNKDTNFVPQFSDAIILSEILPNPKGKDRGQEWVEIENRGEQAVDLRGWKISDGKKEHLFEKSRVVPASGFLVLKNNELGLRFKNSRGQLALLNPLEQKISELVWEEKISDGIALAAFGERRELTKTTTPTPGAPNILTQKNSAENPHRPALSELEDLPRGDWVQLAGWVAIVPDAVQKNALWLTDGQLQVRLAGRNFPQLKFGDRVQVLGKISRPRQTGTQISISGKHAVLRKINGETQMPVLPAQKLAAETVLRANTIYEIEQEVIEQKRHSVKLASGHLVNLRKMKPPPLLYPGDILVARGIAQPSTKSTSELDLVVWEPEKVQIILPENPFSGLATEQATPPTSTTQIVVVGLGIISVCLMGTPKIYQWLIGD